MSENGMRKVLVVLVDRANYGRLKPVMRAIQHQSGLTLQVIAAGTMVLERFSRPVDEVLADGFPIDGEVFIELEGSTPVTMAKSIGFATIEFASEFQRLKPDFVLVIGDRYEALAATVAAAYMNLCLVHIQGGEVSGSIDESTRHAISKLSHFHFPSTKRSAEYLVRMGEHPDTILGIGCPSSDIARNLDRTLSPEILNDKGSGTFIEPSKPFSLVVFHPITTQYGREREQITILLEVLHEVHIQTLLLWPNIDAGADHISKSIRLFRNHKRPDWLRTITNLSPENYLKVLANTACAIGNSSSFVRDASFFGTPVVLVGDRQNGRETDLHVTCVAPEAEEIERAIRLQLQHGSYSPSMLYGNGGVSKQIASALACVQPYVQKRLAYGIDIDSTDGTAPHSQAWNLAKTII